jgi:hypothetical protein
MSRTVVTQADIERELKLSREQAIRTAEAGAVAAAPAPSPQKPDEYRDRLVKYIPADIVAIYLSLLALIKAANPDKTPIITIEWVIFGIIFVVSVPWQTRVMKIDKWRQVAIGTVAFVLWAITLGDPFATSWSAWYQPLYGSIVLMLFTFLIPLFQAQKSGNGTSGN